MTYSFNGGHMANFAQLANSLTDSASGWTLDISDNWKQGRTLYGGLTTGLCYEATQRALGGLPPLRSCQISFVGPVSSTPHIKAKTLRQGRNVTTVQTDMYIGDQNVATAALLFGAGRESKLTVGHSAPEATAPEDYPSYFPDEIAAFAPAFTHNFDIKLIEGGRPITGAERGYIRVWARHKDPASRNGMGSFLTLGDVLPPAALPMFKKMGPVSSMNWQINILNEAMKTEDGWWQIETELTASSRGYSSQIMRYWNSEGQLCAEATQSVTIFI